MDDKFNKNDDNLNRKNKIDLKNVKADINIDNLEIENLEIENLSFDGEISNENIKNINKDNENRSNILDIRDSSDNEVLNDNDNAPFESADDASFYDDNKFDDTTSDDLIDYDEPNAKSSNSLEEQMDDKSNSSEEQNNGESNLSEEQKNGESNSSEEQKNGESNSSEEQKDDKSNSSEEQKNDKSNSSEEQKDGESNSSEEQKNDKSNSSEEQKNDKSNSSEEQKDDKSNSSEEQKDDKSNSSEEQKDDKSNSTENKKDDKSSSSEQQKEENANKENNQKKNESDSSKNQKNHNSNADNKSNKKENGLNKKRNELKDKWNNRPKNMNDVKDRAKDKLNNKKDAVKDKIKNAPKKIANNAKNRAMDSLNDTGLGQAINGTKNAINNTKNAINNAKKGIEATKKVGKAASKAVSGLVKFLVATFPWNIAVVGGGVALVLGITLITTLLTPGINGNTNDSDQLSHYSEKDQKTIEKIHKLFNEHPSADGTIAMATVLYPYFEQLQDGNVKGYFYSVDRDPDEEIDDSETVEDLEDIEELDDEPTKVDDDYYLVPFRSSKMRRRLKKVLKELEQGDDSFKQYLKDKYFKKDTGYNVKEDDLVTGYNGYKKMFSAAKGDNTDELADKIIENIYGINDIFMNYVYDRVSCTPTSSSLSYKDVGGIISGVPVIVLKDTSSGDFSTIKSARSLYGTENLNLDLKRYVMGVVYSEVGDYAKNEAVAKAVIITSKSFVLGRTSPGSGTGVGMGYGFDKENDKTIFYMRANTYDQDFCDVYEGCKSGTYSKSNITAGNSEAKINVKGKLDDASIANLSKWYDEVANEFVYDEQNNGFAGSQYNNYNSNCVQGRCLSQSKAIELASQGRDYTDILYNKSYGAFSNYTVYNAETSYLTKVTSECTGTSTNGGCGIAESDFKYYDQKNYQDSFCGTSETIARSGCGVTSMAMVISNLTDTVVEPTFTSNEAKSANQGFCGPNMETAASYFPYSANLHGLTAKFIPSTKEGANEVIETIKSGGLVIAHVIELSPFTSGGHYIVLRKASGDGTVYVADPNHAEFMNTPYKVTDFVDKNWLGSGGWYAFTSSKSDEIVEKYCTALGEGYLGNPLDPADTTHQFTSNDFPHYKSGGAHSGIDLNNSNGGAKEGDPVYAMDSGVVTYAGNYGYNCYGYCSSGQSMGLGVKINMENGYTVWYAHFSRRVVEQGDKVQKGQIIGYVGNTGNSAGAHLHISLQNDELYSKYGFEGARGHNDRGFMNPAKYINSNESYVGKTK